MSIRVLFPTATLAALSLLVMACDVGRAEASESGATSPVEPTSASAQQVQAEPAEDAHQQHHPAESQASTVEVSEDGTQFDPPVSPEQIPSGAWMCSMMGQVHYASMQPGDCPICGMHLTQQAEAEGTGSPMPHDQTNHMHHME